jgi:hypothetical protein
MPPSSLDGTPRVESVRLERWATAIAFGITALMIVAGVLIVGLLPSPGVD